VDQYVSLNLSGSPQIPRNMAGHGSVTTRSPPAPGPTCVPESSTTSTVMPGMGTCALPGFVAVRPGSALIMMAPVSVCHQVSTMGVIPEPMTSRYHIHASGLMGSPTDPKRRNEERSYFWGISRPNFINVRMAVGAV